MVNTQVFGRVIELVDALGTPKVVDRALRHAGLSRDLLSAPPGYVPLAQEAVFAEFLARDIGAAHLGTEIGRRLRYDMLDWYARYVLASSSLGAALTRGAQALPIIHPGCGVVQRVQSGHVVLGFDTGIGHVVGARHIEESLPLILIDLVRHFRGPDWQPAWIELPGKNGNGAGGLEKLLSVPVHFDAPAPAIALRLADLRARNPVRRTVRAAIALADLPGLAGVAPPETATDTVREVLRLQFLAGDTSQEAVASRMRIGVRTLQRRLMAEGTTFRDVLSELLRDRACALLQESDFSIDEIAASLGYSETNSFRRAFRDWSGMTPTAYSTRTQAR